MQHCDSCEQELVDIGPLKVCIDCEKAWGREDQIEELVGEYYESIK